MHLSPLLSTAMLFRMYNWLVIIVSVPHTECPHLCPVCAGVGDGDGGGSGHSDEQRRVLGHALHQIHHLLQGADRLAVQRRQDGRCCSFTVIKVTARYDVSQLSTAFLTSAVAHGVSPGRGMFLVAWPRQKVWEFVKFSGEGRKLNANNTGGGVRTQMWFIRMYFVCRLTSIAWYDGFQLVKRSPDCWPLYSLSDLKNSMDLALQGRIYFRVWEALWMWSLMEKHRKRKIWILVLLLFTFILL